MNTNNFYLVQRASANYPIFGKIYDDECDFSSNCKIYNAFCPTSFAPYFNNYYTEKLYKDIVVHKVSDVTVPLFCYYYINFFCCGDIAITDALAYKKIKGHLLNAILKQIALSHPDCNLRFSINEVKTAEKLIKVGLDFVEENNDSTPCNPGYK